MEGCGGLIEARRSPFVFFYFNRVDPPSDRGGFG